MASKRRPPYTDALARHPGFWDYLITLIAVVGVPVGFILLLYYVSNGGW